MFTSNYRHVFSSIVLGLLASTFVGCANLNGVSTASLFGSKKETPVAPAAGECVVEFRGRGKPKIQKLAVTDQTRIQDVLQQSGATDKFRKMNAYILRRSPRDPKQVVKLEANYDRKERKVSWSTDYAVMAGDRIVVLEDNSTVIDQAVGAILPPILRDGRK